MPDQTPPPIKSDENESIAAEQSSLESPPTHIDQSNETQGHVGAPQQGKTEMNENNSSGGKGGKGLSLFAILVSLAALGGSGYVVYKNELAGQADQNKVLVGVNGIASDVGVLAERMNQLRREQDELSKAAVTQAQFETGLLQANTSIDGAVREIKQTQTNLQDALEKMAQTSQNSADKLAIDEVSQLLKLANNSAVFAGDKASALSALRLADSQLKQLADPRYAVVRRSIGQEIEALEAIESVDVASVTVALHSIAKRVPNLPLENEPPVVERVELVDSPSEAPFSMTSELKKLWSMMVNSVSIKRVDEPPKPLLAPEQRFFLDQNIQLKLSTAELALMQQQSAIYQRSIDEALMWLLEYYDPRDSDVKEVADRLRELRQQNLGIELPSIARSYDQLQQIRGGN